MKKYKIGYTTGVFDMFHIGHLNILKRAKEQCEYLIVGVSTDELAFQYKKRKPIIPYEQRIEIINAIKYVDCVIPQTNLNKIEAWNKLKFNVIFHGSDWENSDIYIEMKKNFRKLGVDMVFFPYTKGISSTRLKEIIKK